MNQEKELIKKKAFKGVSWKFMERVIAQSVSFIVSIIIARRLTPSDYSPVAIVTIFFSFSNIIISGGLNTALIQKKDADIEDYSTVMNISLILSVIVYIIFFLSAPSISQLYKQSILIPIIRVMAVVLPVYAMKAVVCAYVSSTLQFRKFFFATLGGTLISAIIGISMAMKGFGAWSLVAQQMTNTIIDTAILIAVTRIKIKLSISLSRLTGLFKYGSKILIASIISTIYEEIYPLIIGIRFSAADLSYYDKGKSFPRQGYNALNDTFAGVMFPVMSQFQDNMSTIQKYTSLFMREVSFVIFPVMIGLLALSNTFVSVFLTNKWLPCSIYIKIYCITYMVDMLNSGNLQSIRAIGRSDVILKLEVFKKSLYFVVIVLFVFFSRSPIVMSMSAFVTSLIAISANAFANNKLINYTIKSQMLDVRVNLYTSMLMGIAVLLLDRYITPSLLSLVFEIFVGVILYFGMNYIIKNEALFYLLKSLRLFKH